jgi:hypothetical protein
MWCSLYPEHLMSRSILRVLPALLVLSALACASPTAPAPVQSHLTTPAAGASFDDITPPADTTCRSGYNVGQARTC